MKIENILIILGIVITLIVGIMALTIDMLLIGKVVIVLMMLFFLTGYITLIGFKKKKDKETEPRVKHSCKCEVHLRLLQPFNPSSINIWLSPKVMKAMGIKKGKWTHYFWSSISNKIKEYIDGKRVR